MSPFAEPVEDDTPPKALALQDLQLLKALGPYVKPHWKILTLSLLLLPLISVTQVLQPFIIKQAVDGPITHHQFPALINDALLFLILIIVHYGLRYAQMVLAQMAGQRIILLLRCDLYDHLQSLDMRFYHRTPLGKLVTRLSSDVENISDVFAQGGIAIFSDLALVIGILVAMAVMNLQLALVTYAVLPLVVVTMIFFRRRSREIYNRMRLQLAELNSYLQESLSGMDIIQLLQRETYNAEAFKNLGRAFMKTNVRSVTYDSAFTAAIEFLSWLTIIAILGYIVLGSPISFGLLVAFLQYIQMLYDPLEEVSDKYTTIQSGLASLEKIAELKAVKPQITSADHAIPLSLAKGHIQFKNVSFSYLPGEPVLKNVSLEIHPGEKIALIGPTGSGKSTLIKLLNRSYDPDEGEILLDGIPIQNYDLSSFRRQVVVIPQDDFLFSRSLQENITLTYQEPVDLSRLKQVTRTVHADAVVDRFDTGFQTILAERGRNISQGERQLLGFARALWHDPRIIILDEATSAIDPHTETLIQDALEKSLVGRTGVVVAHRLSTVRNVDRVYQLSHGEIIRSGSPEEILQ